MSEISDEMVETISATVHEAWIAAKREQGIDARRSEWGEDLMVPYAELSDRAKDLDRATVRAVIPAAYPLLRAQVREEVARDIEAAPDAILPPSSVDRSRVAAIARGVAADGAEQMTVERAEARDEQED